MSKKLLTFGFLALIMVLYFATLAPTVLWGDDASLQRSAFNGTLPHDGGGHWLWYAMARLIVKLPIGEVAYKVNMLSALAGFATIIGLYWAAKSIDLSRTASVLTAGSMAVAHTFWMHSVRAEVYTIFTALMVFEITMLLRWMKKDIWPLFVALAIFGLILLSHQMAMLLLPTIGYSIWLNRGRLSRRNAILAIGFFFVGLIPALFIIQQQINSFSMTQSLIIYFTHSGADFSHSLFDFSISKLPRDTVLWLGFLMLQFPSPAILLGLFGFASFREKFHDDRWKIVAVLYFTCVIFAFSYRVNDQFVFYLPSYIAFSLFVGLGWDNLSNKKSWLKQTYIARIVVGLVMILPPLMYFGLAIVIKSLDINPLQIRELPGREPNSYFLWPAKNNYWGAYNYGSSVLTNMPLGSILIADHTPYQTLKYLQVVHNFRNDVRLISIKQRNELSLVVKSLPSAIPIFIADNDPRYYNFDDIAGAKLIKRGFAYQLVL